MTSNVPQEESKAKATLRKARKHYADISEALLQMRPQVIGNDDKAMRDFLGVVQTHWKAFQTVLDREIDLEKSDRERAGIAHGYAIDLAAARSEVGRRLACLKNAETGEGVFGGVE